jgi:hypothetical protein
MTADPRDCISWLAESADTTPDDPVLATTTPATASANTTTNPATKAMRPAAPSPVKKTFAPDIFLPLFLVVGWLSSLLTVTTSFHSSRHK